jgi:predicted dehydrogenase
MIMKPLRIGIIGCGYWGPNLIRNFVEIPGSEVVAVSDLRQERLAHIKSRFPAIKVTQDYETLFHMDLDGVVIATPPATHYQLARECLLHDLPVMVEKPLALSSADCIDLIRLAKLKSLALMVGHTYEYHPAVRTLRRIVQSGELGQIYYISSVRVNLGLFQRDLNVVWDLAPHDLSMIQFLLEQEPISVGATGGSYVIPGVHDIAHLHLGFPDRVIAHVHVSWLDPRKVRRLTVVGSRKMAVFDDVEPTEKIKIYDKGVEAPPYTDTLAEFHLSYRYGDVLIPHIEGAEPLRLECEDFVRAVAYGMEPQSGGESGLRVIRILEAASRSLENGGGGELMLDEQILIDEQAQV